MNKIILGRNLLLFLGLLNSTVVGFFIYCCIVYFGGNFNELHFKNAEINLTNSSYTVYFSANFLLLVTILLNLKYISLTQHIIDKFVVALSMYCLFNITWLIFGFMQLKLITIFIVIALLMNSLWIFQLLCHEREKIENESSKNSNFKLLFSLTNTIFSLLFAWNTLILLLTINNSLFQSFQQNKTWVAGYLIFCLLIINSISTLFFLKYKKKLIAITLIFFEINFLMFFIDDGVIINFIVIAILLNALILYLSKNKSYKPKTLLETQFSD